MGVLRRRRRSSWSDGLPTMSAQRWRGDYGLDGRQPARSDRDSSAADHRAAKWSHCAQRTAAGWTPAGGVIAARASLLCRRAAAERCSSRPRATAAQSDTIFDALAICGAVPPPRSMRPRRRIWSSIADGVLVWRHPLVRSAIYYAASPPARRDAHAALAQAEATPGWRTIARGTSRRRRPRPMRMSRRNSSASRSRPRGAVHRRRRCTPSSALRG